MPGEPNAPTMEMSPEQTDVTPVDAGANGLQQATPEYTFGNESMGASPLSQEYIDGTTYDFEPDARLGSTVDTQADALEGLPDTDAAVEKSLSDLYESFDKDPDSLSDADLDRLAEDENKRIAETQNNVATEKTDETDTDNSVTKDSEDATTGEEADADATPAQDSEQETSTPPEVKTENTQPKAEQTPKEGPRSTISRQNEVNAKIEALQAKGEAITDEEKQELSRLESQKSELDEFSVLEHKMKNPDASGGLTEADKQRYTELDKKLNPKNETEADANTQLEQLQGEMNQLQEDLASGKLTSLEASNRLTENFTKREKLVKNLVDRLEKNDKKLSPYEREVAETAREMQQRMYEVMAAPKIVKEMEDVLKGLKGKLKDAEKFKINKDNINSEDARANVAERSTLSRQIAAQATHMARYGNIVRTNMREFLTTNSKLMRLVGVRSGLRDMAVQVGVGVMKTIDRYSNDMDARYIARTGKTPTWDSVR